MNSTHKKEKWIQRWKSIVHINEECYILQNNEKLEKKNRFKTCKQPKRLLKCTLKLNDMLKKVFENNLVSIRKNKVTLTLFKPAYDGTCVLEFGKVLRYEFHYGHIKNKYGNNSRLLFRDTDTFMYKIKTEDVYEYFSNDKEMFDFRNYLSKSKYYIDLNKLVVGKMKVESGGVAIESCLT